MVATRTSGAGSAASTAAHSSRHSTAAANWGTCAAITAVFLETFRIWRESTRTVTKRNRRKSRLPLLIVLLINTAVTGSGWAMAAPAAKADAPEQPVASHMDCGEAMGQMGETMESPTLQTAAQHQHSSSDGCCTPGTCHCAPPSPTGDLTVVPLRAPLVRVTSISPRQHGALPAPDLTRLLRPPIV
jgi:hypothetical protein